MLIQQNRYEKVVNHFYLDKPENTKSVIMVSISFESHRLRLSTGISISTKSWDKKFERIKNSYSHSSEINTILSNFKAKVEDIFTHAKYQKVQLTITTLKNEIDLYLHPEKLLKKEGTFFEHFSNFIMYRSRDSRFGS